MEDPWVPVTGAAQADLSHTMQLVGPDGLLPAHEAVSLPTEDDIATSDTRVLAKRKRTQVEDGEEEGALKRDQEQAQTQPETGKGGKRRRAKKSTADTEEGNGADAPQIQGQKKAPTRRSKRQKAQEVTPAPEDRIQTGPDQIPPLLNPGGFPSINTVITDAHQQDPLAGFQLVQMQGLDPHGPQNHPNIHQDLLQHNTEHEDQKYSTFQVRAWIANGQPLDLPGYQWPGPLPHVQMGARWQLDLRTGERLEDHNSAQLNMNHLATLQGQHPNAFTVHNAALAAQALGTRNLQWNGAPQGGAQQNYGLSQAMYNTPYGLPGSSQQASQSLAANNGSYSALLAPQILAAQGLIAQHNQANPGAIQNLPALQHLVGNTRQNERRTRTATELEDLSEPPDIPLRRRGRPAGDGSGSVASPQELLERRMQANRAAASRSHFRRKREMEILDKDCAITEARIQELRMGLTALMQQEEQLRMQQQTIRSQLAAGIKPDESLSMPQFLPHQALTHEPTEAHEMHHQMILQ